MTPDAIPAPLWRRLAAAVYDALLLLGLWLSSTFIAWIVAHLFGHDVLPPTFMRAYLFVITFGFFGWFWTHGGQTLGMRAWRLQLRRTDGTALNWPIAMLRFAAAIPAWLFLLGILWSLLDHRRRCWHDLAAGTEVLQMPKTAA
ncbi:MAG: RDD family protein [Nevskiaceae bacterium]|nr:MAG: RDD family protein [Nevskiaceae bacterium]